MICLADKTSSFALKGEKKDADANLHLEKQQYSQTIPKQLISAFLLVCSNFQSLWKWLLHV